MYVLHFSIEGKSIHTPAKILPLARRLKRLPGVENDLGPGLQGVAAGAEFLDRQESKLGDGFLAGADFGSGKLHEMDDAEMDAADLGFVIVDESDDTVLEGAFESQLLLDLTVHGSAVGGLVEGEETLVLIVDMAADADRALGDQTLLAGLRAADVVEDFSLMHEDTIRDELLEGGIVLGLRAGHEEIILALEEGVEVIFGGTVEALESAQLVEKRAADDEDLFFAFGHGGEMLSAKGLIAKRKTVTFLERECLRTATIPAMMQPLHP